jgi:hypothetical protein
MVTSSVAAWKQRHGEVFSDLANATLSLSIAMSRAAMATEARSSDQPAALRASRTAAHRLRWVLQFARALPVIPDLDSERHFRAGIARWTDAVGAVAESSSTVDLDEVQRAVRAGQAGGAELQRCVRSMRQALQSETTGRGGRRPLAA